MKNLAGDPNAETHIESELSLCGVPIVLLPKHKRGEVPSPIWGKLGNFTFYRAWTYYIVSGMVPFDIAMEIFQTVIGSRYVRAGGDCGPVSPDSYVSGWFAEDGRQVIDIAQKAGFDDFISKGYLVREEVDKKYLFAVPADFPQLGNRYVTCYHVDTQEGLNLLLDVLRKHKLV